MMIWDKDESPPLFLLTPEEISQLPDNTLMESISGNHKRKDLITNFDTRLGHTACGIRDIENHPLKETLLLFLLS